MRKHPLGERLGLDDSGKRHVRGCGSCSPAQPSLDGGATEMLGRIIVYAYVVMLAISVLLEKPIPLAIGP